MHGKMLKYLILFGSLISSVRSNEEESLTFSTLVYKTQGVCIPGVGNMSDINPNTTCSNSSISLNPKNTTTQILDFPEKHYIKVMQQNRILLSELVYRSFYNTKPPENTTHPEFGFQHLSTAFSIYSKICPFVPIKFLQKIYHLFSLLHWKTATDRTEFLAKSHHKWITRLMNNCTEFAEAIHFHTDVCKENVVATETCESVICTKPDYEFRLKKADLLLDAVFKVFELTQSVCFPFFNESYRMFHFFRLAVMDTFTDDMKIRWITPIENEAFYMKLLGPGFQMHFVNMEKCNEAVISRQKLYFRIMRNSLPARIRLGGQPKKV